MKKFISFLFFTFSLNSFAEIGLTHGSDLSVIRAQGKVLIQCTMDGSNGPFMNSYYCRRDIVTAGNYDYFTGPNGVLADTVQLIARHQDGSETTKKVDYDSKLNRSNETINLWIKTLFQKPLLSLGVNEVQFKMFKKKALVASGVFVVNVRDAGERICAHEGRYWSNNSDDCRSGQFVCNRYFNENNFCQSE